MPARRQRAQELGVGVAGGLGMWAGCLLRKARPGKPTTASSSLHCAPRSCRPSLASPGRPGGYSGAQRWRGQSSVHVSILGLAASAARGHPAGPPSAWSGRPRCAAAMLGRRRGATSTCPVVWNRRCGLPPPTGGRAGGCGRWGPPAALAASPAGAGLGAGASTRAAAATTLLRLCRASSLLDLPKMGAGTAAKLIPRLLISGSSNSPPVAGSMPPGNSNSSLCSHVPVDTCVCVSVTLLDVQMRESLVGANDPLVEAREVPANEWQAARRSPNPAFRLSAPALASKGVAVVPAIAASQGRMR